MKAVTAVVGVALLMGSAFSASAQKAPTEPPPGYRGLLIAPPRYELTLERGEKSQRQFAVWAKGYNQAITIEVAVMDWTENSKGALIPLEPGSTPYSAAKWIKVALDPLSLAPDKPLSVPFEVKVPNIPLDGSYWTAITFSTKPTPAKNKRGIAVANRLRIWGIVYVTIKGTERPDAVIQNFAIAEDAIILDIANKGNIYLRLHPKLYFRDAQGEVLTTRKLPEKVLLRDNLIRYRIPLKGTPKEAVIAAVEIEAKGLASPLYAEVALK